MPGALSALAPPQGVVWAGLCLGTIVACDHTLSTAGPPSSILVKLQARPTYSAWDMICILMVSTPSPEGRGAALEFPGQNQLIPISSCTPFSPMGRDLGRAFPAGQAAEAEKSQAGR